MSIITKTTTTEDTFPIFKTAIYNSTVANNTNFFGSDLTPSNTPVAFTFYYVANGNGGAGTAFPWLQRTNGGNVVLEQIGANLQFTSNAPAVLQTVVGPSDSINLKMPTGSGSASIVTLIVLESEIVNAPSPTAQR